MAKNAKQDLIPMPPIGWPVQFYERGNKKLPFAGVVIGHNQDPGQCKIAYHVNTMHRMSDNATLAAKVDGKPLSETVTRYGTWDYLPGQEIPDAHYDFHLKRLDDLEKAVKIREETMAAAKASYEASLKQQPNAAGAAVQRAVAAMQMQGG